MWYNNNANIIIPERRTTMAKAKDLIELEQETNRLNKMGVNFKFYDDRDEGMLGIVVDAKDQSPENVELIRRAGYGPGRDYPANGKKKIYQISVEKLLKIHHLD